jgi:hypothetical protein
MSICQVAISRRWGSGVKRENRQHASAGWEHDVNRSIMTGAGDHGGNHDVLQPGSESGMTDRRDEERERIRREDDERRREERERRGEELREAWRRHHPRESERDKDSWPKKGPPA